MQVAEHFERVPARWLPHEPYDLLAMPDEDDLLSFVLHSVERLAKGASDVGDGTRSHRRRCI